MQCPLPGNVHFIGICGRATSCLAITLTGRGVRVTGSDRGVYGETPSNLRAAGVDFTDGYAEANLPADAAQVIVSGYVKADNPELIAARERNLPVSTFPRFLADNFIPAAGSLVVAGTNGKTTTTAMLAWILETAGAQPDYFIGGGARNFARPSRLTGAPVCVLEGDEFPSSLEDPSPKFLHYRPRCVTLTNLAHDHIDTFPTEGAYLANFEALIDILPGGGALITNADDPACVALAGRTSVRHRLVGFGRGAEMRITAVHQTAAGLRFRFQGSDLFLPGIGKMNVLNACLAAATAMEQGIGWPSIRQALATFQGVSGRQEPLAGPASVLLMRDDAYHPAALRELLLGVRRRYPRRRLVLALQPRYTGGLRGPFQADLPEALACADVVLATGPVDFAGLVEPFSSEQLGADLRARGVDARFVAPRQLSADLAGTLRRGDVLVLSMAYRNEPFYELLATALAQRNDL